MYIFDWPGGGLLEAVSGPVAVKRAARLIPSFPILPQADDVFILVTAGDDQADLSAEVCWCRCETWKLTSPHRATASSALSFVRNPLVASRALLQYPDQS